jgi:two-component system, chemotaxis family, chemotaxis protein CheY
MRKKMILVVDDNPLVRRSMRSSIEQHPNLRVCGEAENGEAAVRMFRKLRPDFVIMDFVMPVKNGLDAAREMSEIDPEIPILMCTMFKSNELVTEARKVGVKKVISKGETAQSLGTTVQDLLAS